MPQRQFPSFPAGVTHITPLLAFRKQDGRVTYVNGSMPVFVRDAADTDSFRMITAQCCVNGNLDSTDADLLPDPQAGTLTIRLHHSANAVTDQAIEKLCAELTATETVFPRTNLRLGFLDEQLSARVSQVWAGASLA